MTDVLETRLTRAACRFAGVLQYNGWYVQRVVLASTPHCTADSPDDTGPALRLLLVVNDRLVASYHNWLAMGQRATPLQLIGGFDDCRTTDDLINWFKATNSDPAVLAELNEASGDTDIMLATAGWRERFNPAGFVLGDPERFPFTQQQWHDAALRNLVYDQAGNRFTHA